MVNKYFECLAVDGNYSKTRIALMLMGIFVLAIFIWLIVLTVQVNNIENPTTGSPTTATPGTGTPITSTTTTTTTTTKKPEDKDWKIVHETNYICSGLSNRLDRLEDASQDECKKFASKNEKANYFVFYGDLFGKRACELYKKCEGDQAHMMPSMVCETFKKDKADGEWNLYRKSENTCGGNPFKDVPNVKNVEKCKEEGSELEDGIYMFYGEKSFLRKSKCSFYKSCDDVQKKGIWPMQAGKTYLKRKN